MAVQLKRNLAYLVIGFVVVVMSAFFGWALFATRSFGSITGGSRALTVLITVGVVGTGALAGILMWLAFYSARKGYDDPPSYEEGEPPSR